MATPIATDTITDSMPNVGVPKAPVPPRESDTNGAANEDKNGRPRLNHKDEAARLAALYSYDILDTPPEQAFDDLALLASAICQTPIAAVTLIDEHRQWFKAAIGIDGSETPRHAAFCAHTIQQDELLIVEDATRDPRFADNPSVLSDPPHIRFYAGAPLVTAEGHALGSLCVVDRVPRQLTTQQGQALAALGRQVATQIEMRRNVQELSVAFEQRDTVTNALRDSESRFRLLAENSSDLIARYSPQGRCLYASPASLPVLGYTPDELVGRLVYDFVYADDLEETLSFHEGRTDLPSTYQLVARARCKDGSIVWLETTGHTIRDERGEIIEFHTSSRDVTARRQAEEALRQSEERYRELIENSIDLIYQTDSEGRFTFFNKTAMRLMKYSREELLGLKYFELIDPNYRAAACRFYHRQFARKIVDTYYEYPTLAKDNTTVWFGQNVHLQIENEHVVGFEAVARDITARKIAEEKQLKMSQGLSAVLNCADELLLIPDLDSLIKRAIELGRERLGLERCAIFLVSPDLEQVRGTFGTNRFGTTTDQRREQIAMHGHWQGQFAPVPAGQRWGVLEDYPLVEWDGHQSTLIGKNGWVAVTRIESASRPIGSFHNDAGLSERALDEAQQEIVAVYCSLLGNIIERKRGEEALVQARDQLELRVRERTAELARANAVLEAEVAERKRAQESQQALTEGLKAVLISADELLAMPDLDSLMRRAVELGHERLRLERCAVFLYSPDGQQMIGAYGINSDGALVAQHDNISGFLPIDWKRNTANLNGARWNISEGPLKDWRHGREVSIGRSGWSAETQIQSARGTLGVMYNDTAMSGAPVNPTQQELVALFCSLLGSILERKRAEELLRQSEERFRLVTEAMPQIIWTAQPDGTLDYYNQRWYEYTGLTTASTANWDWQGILYTEDMPACLERWRHSLGTGEIFEAELRFRRHDDIYRWHLIRALPLHDSRGEIVSWVGTCTDIDDQKGITEMLRRSRDELEATVVERMREISEANHVLHAEINERKQAEIALRDSDERFRAFMNNSAVAAFMKSAQGRFIYVNDTLCRRFNVNPEDWLGKTNFEVMAPEVAAAVTENDRQVLASDQVRQLLEVVPTPDGQSRYWLVNKFPLRDAGGQKYLGGIAVDVTEQKRAEAELQLLTEELKRSNAELEQFAYIASHDLQEPLRVVVSFLQLLEKRYGEQLVGDGKEFLDYAVDGSRRMQRLINDLLDYSRVGTRSKRFAPVNIELALKNALLNLNVAIEESAAEVTFDALPTVPGDASQLTRLFQNLIANALKFHDVTPPRVHITANEREGEWLFSVRDNGIGIAPEHRDRIFAVFQRLHTRAEYPGTGIGLAICRKTVELHGGHIWVASQAGEGSTFFFSLPKSERSRRSNVL